MNLQEEEKRYDVVHKAGDELANYGSLNNRERVFLRACLLNRGIDDLKMLVGYDIDRSAAKGFLVAMTSKLGFSQPAMLWGDFSQDRLLAVQKTVSGLYELKKRSLFQRLFNR